MFNKALLPLDVGFIPRRALRTAAAAVGGGSLTLLYVIDAGRDAPLRGAYRLLPHTDVQLFGSHIYRAIGDALAVVSEYGPAATALVALGGPVHTVVSRVAEALRSDVIVMGARSRRGLSRVLRGSVTEAVIAESEIPVLVVYEFAGDNGKTARSSMA